MIRVDLFHAGFYVFDFVSWLVNETIASSLMRKNGKNYGIGRTVKMKINQEQVFQRVLQYVNLCAHRATLLSIYQSQDY